MLFSQHMALYQSDYNRITKKIAFLQKILYTTKVPLPIKSKPQVILIFCN
jgi:hypothetical protein